MAPTHFPTQVAAASVLETTAGKAGISFAAVAFLSICAACWLCFFLVIRRRRERKRLATVIPAAAAGAASDIGATVGGLSATEEEEKRLADIVALRAAVENAKLLQNAALMRLAEMKPRLGLAIEPSPPTQPGVTVVAVKKDSSGAAAGIVPGDIITAFSGVPIDSPNDFQRELIKHEVGDELTLTVLRDGNELDLQLRMGSKDQSLEEVLEVHAQAHTGPDPELVAKLTALQALSGPQNLSVVVPDDSSDEDSTVTNDESDSMGAHPLDQPVMALSPTVAADPTASTILLKQLLSLSGKKKAIGTVSPLNIPKSTKAIKARLGITIEDDNSAGRPGVRIVKIDPNGPAAAVGMRLHDVITSLNGVETPNSEAFTREQKKVHAFDDVMFGLRRPQDMTICLSQMPIARATPPPGFAYKAQPNRPASRNSFDSEGPSELRTPRRSTSPPAVLLTVKEEVPRRPPALMPTPTAAEAKEAPGTKSRPPSPPSALPQRPLPVPALRRLPAETVRPVDAINDPGSQNSPRRTMAELLAERKEAQQSVSTPPAPAASAPPSLPQRPLPIRVPNPVVLVPEDDVEPQHPHAIPDSAPSLLVSPGGRSRRSMEELIMSRSPVSFGTSPRRSMHELISGRAFANAPPMSPTAVSAGYHSTSSVDDS